MQNNNNLFIEATLSNRSYMVLWRGTNGIKDIDEALKIMKEHSTNDRIELWSKAHSNSPNGFAPMAYRAANSDKVVINSILNMLMNSPQA